MLRTEFTPSWFKSSNNEKKSSVVQETMIGKTIFLVKPRWAISSDEPRLTTPKSRVYSCVYIHRIYQTVSVQSDKREKDLTFSPVVPRGPASPVRPERPFGPSGPSSPLGPGGPSSPWKAQWSRYMTCATLRLCEMIGKGLNTHFKNLS